jgi:60 kDa SS-A/Ro ribonucleoprotein
MADPLMQVSTRHTPQSQKADVRQVPNSAGGFTFTVGRTARLRRFLTLGTDGGTYYTSERDITQANAGVVLGWAREDATALTAQVVAVSSAGRAPRNNPALFALAAAASLGDETGRKAALGALPLVARTGTHLFIFARYVQQFRGWGRGLRRAVGDWYLGKDVSDIAYQALKYRQREGWTHRDMLRLSHPAGEGAHRALFDWICGREADLAGLPLVQAFVRAQAATTPHQWCELVAANPALSWEMLPDAALTDVTVWRALIGNGMPQTALMRQLPRLTRLGVLTPMSAITGAVASQLADRERLTRARVHPVNVLVALRTYAGGRSARGDGEWKPVPAITDALDAAFYAAFAAVEPAGKRTMLALDVSGSMTQAVSGLPISCREASAALALVTAATEPQTVVTGFTSSGHGYGRYGGRWGGGDTGLSVLDISPRQRLDDAIRKVSALPFGGTDCALPMLAALQQGMEIDHFTIYTDNETWAGSVHPHQALRDYREKTGIAARMSVVGMTATDFTIADPDDPGTLDVAGFDSAVPALLADFARGDI